MIAEIRKHALKMPKSNTGCNWKLVVHSQRRQGKKEIIVMVNNILRILLS